MKFLAFQVTDVEEWIVLQEVNVEYLVAVLLIHIAILEIYNLLSYSALLTTLLVFDSFSENILSKLIIDGLQLHYIQVIKLISLYM